MRGADEPRPTRPDEHSIPGSGAQDDFERLEALFQAAADRPVHERASFLAASAAPPRLRERVVAMLARLERDASLASPWAGAALPGGPEPSAGDRIGRWRLVEELGAGGFGVVWRAEPEGPVATPVALKLIKLGMDTREVVARFEAEREALARMDHPGIARVLDAGVSDQGRPYFVMELVEGQSITEHCDARRLGTRARLELFVKVCQAVQHAHQKGVVHRDLKPSNVLISARAGEDAPKVIDFGIAKAIQGRLGEHSLMTAEGRLVGTPAYMSPEQAGGALDVDTRADVYSLGVLLYELLTGTTPFDGGQLLRAGLLEARRVIREVVPERPSTRIAARAGARHAATRASEAQALARSLRGDLDWIVGRALEKDPARRFASASELAADVERHLTGEPVLACPPSAAYRVRKALARHRAAFGTAASLLVVLVAGIFGTSLSMLEAGRQRDEALAARRDAEAVEDFLVRTLGLADPEVAGTPELPVRVLLDRASLEVAERFALQPRAEARVRATLGRAYAKLGANETAEAHLSRAVELASPHGGRERVLAPLEHYATLWALTHVSFWLERPEAHETARAARDVALACVAEAAPELSERLALLTSTTERGAYATDPAAIGELAPLLDDCVRLGAAALSEGDPLWPLVADTYIAAAYMLWYSSFETASLPLLEAALQIQRRELGRAHPDTAKTLGLWVGVLLRAGRGAEAEQDVREAVRSLRASHARGSYARAVAESMLGAILLEYGRFEEAEPWIVDSHTDLVASLGGPTSFLVQDSYSRVIELYERWGRHDLTEVRRVELARGIADGHFVAPYGITMRVLDDAWSELRSALESLHASLGEITYALDVLPQTPEGASTAASRAARAFAQRPGSDPRTTACARLALRFASRIPIGGAGHDERYRLLSELESILGLPGAAGGDSAWTALDHAETLALLARVDQLSGRAALGRERALRARERLGALPTSEHWAFWIQAVAVSDALAGAEERAAARAILTPSLRALEAQLGADHPSTRAARERLELTSE